MFNGIFYPDLLFYEKPFQVIFIRPDCAQAKYEQGIAYKTSVIAARDGEVFTTRQIMACARKYGVDYDYAIVEAFEWVPLEIN